jgi:hypothetical protein
VLIYTLLFFNDIVPFGWAEIVFVVSIYQIGYYGGGGGGNIEVAIYGGGGENGIHDLTIDALICLAK